MFSKLALIALLGVSASQSGSELESTEESAVTYGLEYRIIHKDSNKCLTFIGQGEELDKKKKVNAEFDTLDIRKCTTDDKKKENQLFQPQYNFEANQFQIYSVGGAQFIQSQYTDEKGNQVEPEKGLRLTVSNEEARIYLIPFNKSEENISSKSREFFFSSTENPTTSSYMVSVGDGLYPSCLMSLSSPFADEVNTDNYVYLMRLEENNVMTQ
mmetsp:Transcript_9259/g.15565  ORF Transcript_9259/g.15565 Transcript_9259/m.15565 type:complete len:213 (-) Transcript_9259:38-676(-)